MNTPAAPQMRYHNYKWNWIFFFKQEHVYVILRSIFLAVEPTLHLCRFPLWIQIWRWGGSALLMQMEYQL